MVESVLARPVERHCVPRRVVLGYFNRNTRQSFPANREQTSCKEEL
jgi:hypothetical protein